MKDFVEKGMNVSKKVALLGGGVWGVGEILVLPVLPLIGLNVLVVSGISYLGLNIFRSSDRKLQ